MASYVLYPPIIDSQMKAFIGADCDIYFSLSKFNSSSDFKSVQISVCEQITNKNYVNPHDDSDNERYRATGIILNVLASAVEGEENLYKVTIKSNDVSPDGGETLGWQIGKTYKIQLRLTGNNAPSITEDTNQASWLNENAGKFSEWSTVCIVKATAKIDYKIPLIDVDSTREDQTSKDNITTFYISTLDLIGSFLREGNTHDSTEFVKSYQFTLYDDTDKILEDSGLIYTENNENNIDKIQYLFTTELEDDKVYKMAFKFESEHGYKDGFYYAEDEDGAIDHRLTFKISHITIDSDNIELITSETAYEKGRLKELDNKDLGIHTHYGKYDHNIGQYNTTIDVLNPIESPSYFENKPLVVVRSENENPDYTVELPIPGEINTIYILIPKGKEQGKVYTWDNLSNKYIQQLLPPEEQLDIIGIKTIDEEEDEGRIGLKFYAAESNPYSGNLCIRRTDSRSNYKIWTDILIYVCIQKNVNEIPVIYDYTIESGVFYKYAVQKIDRDGNRSIIKTSIIELQQPVLRNFNYSFLLGKNNQQLKLKFDNTMPNFKYQVIESKLDPINSVYPIATRNASTKYRTFPINGLISCMMDDEKVFTDKEKIYGELVARQYQDYNSQYKINDQYDFIYERDYRQKVLDFLYDGEFKLFKSPTEGNIIVRLMDINCTPIQSLDRMLYSFTATAYEMAEATMENLRKYGFYDPGTYATEFTTYSTHIGQLQMDIPISQNINILNEIYKKYDSKGQNLGGYLKKIGDVYCLKITFDSKPMKVMNYSGDSGKGEPTLGYSFQYSGTQSPIVVHYPNNMYEFDERMYFNVKTDSIKLLGSLKNFPDENQSKDDVVSVTVDFLYDIATETWMGRRIQQLRAKTNIGEFFEECTPNENIYNELYYKYYLDWYTKEHKEFRRLNRISSIEIEANPGTVLWIRDESDGTTTQDYFTIGDTGKLRLYELANILNLKYIGIRKSDGTIDTTKRQDILVKYIGIIFEGTYKDE